MTTFIMPRLPEAKELLEQSSREGSLVILIGRCSVHYQGRANSKLSPGERVVVIKQDGALLVHRAAGYEPVNWMPGQTVTYHVQIINENLEIRANRRKPAESVTVLFHKILSACAFTLKDEGEFALYASEKDMQKAILLKPSLLEEGFKPISYEKKVEPGFVDVYGTDRDGRLVVVEIKRKTASKEAVLQLAKYMDAVRSRADRKVRGLLAAPDIAKDVQRLLASLGLGFKRLDPKKCSETLRRSKSRKLADFIGENAKISE